MMSRPRARRCRPLRSLSRAFLGAEDGDAAAGEDAFSLRPRARQAMQGVLDAGLLLLHSRLRSAAPTLIWATPPASLARRLIELLAVVVAGGVLDLVADHVHAVLDVGRLAGTLLDDDRVVLVDRDLLGRGRGRRDRRSPGPDAGNQP